MAPAKERKMLDREAAARSLFAHGPFKGACEWAHLFSLSRTLDQKKERTTPFDYKASVATLWQGERGRARRERRRRRTWLFSSKPLSLFLFYGRYRLLPPPKKKTFEGSPSFLFPSLSLRPSVLPPVRRLRTLNCREKGKTVETCEKTEKEVSEEERDFCKLGSEKNFPLLPSFFSLLQQVFLSCVCEEDFRNKQRFPHTYVSLTRVRNQEERSKSNV